MDPIEEYIEDEVIPLRKSRWNDNLKDNLKLSPVKDKVSSSKSPVKDKVSSSKSPSEEPIITLESKVLPVKDKISRRKSRSKDKVLSSKLPSSDKVSPSKDKVLSSKDKISHSKLHGKVKVSHDESKISSSKSPVKVKVSSSKAKIYESPSMESAMFISSNDTSASKKDISFSPVKIKEPIKKIDRRTKRSTDNTKNEKDDIKDKSMINTSATKNTEGKSNVVHNKVKVKTDDTNIHIDTDSSSGKNHSSATNVTTKIRRSKTRSIPSAVVDSEDKIRRLKEDIRIVSPRSSPTRKLIVDLSKIKGKIREVPMTPPLKHHVKPNIYPLFTPSTELKKDRYSSSSRSSASSSSSGTSRSYTKPSKRYQISDSSSSEEGPDIPDSDSSSSEDDDSASDTDQGKEEQTEDEKWQILKVRVKMLKERKPDLVLHINKKKHSYQTAVKMYDNAIHELLFTQDNLTAALVLVLAWGAIEGFARYALGWKWAEGYTLSQIESFYQYDVLLLELGERSYLAISGNASIEVRILKISIQNFLIFAVMKNVMSGDGLMKGLSFLTNLGRRNGDDGFKSQFEKPKSGPLPGGGSSKTGGVSGIVEALINTALGKLFKGKGTSEGDSSTGGGLSDILGGLFTGESGGIMDMLSGLFNDSTSADKGSTDTSNNKPNKTRADIPGFTSFSRESPSGNKSPGYFKPPPSFD